MRGQAAGAPGGWAVLFPTKKDLFPFGLVGKRRHHQTAGPLLSAFTQLMCVDMLHGLPEFGADPFVLRKTNFPLFRCGCKEAPSPKDGPTAKHIQPVTALEQAARPPGL